MTVKADPGDSAHELLCRAEGARDIGRPEMARELYQEALAFDPDLVGALDGMGRLLVERGEFRLARSFFIRAARITRSQVHWRETANCLRLEERFTEARRVFELIAPSSEEPDTHWMHGLLLYEQNKLAEAVEAYERALALDPGHAWAAWDLALAYLAGGNYVRGFDGYGARFKVWTPDAASAVPPWKGDACDHLWVRAEQGLGDSLMSFRFLDRCPVGRITLDVPRPLFRLLARNRTDRTRIVFREEAENAPAGADRACRMMDLPGLLHAWTPNGTPYLAALTPFDIPARPGLKIGVCWESASGDHVLSYRQRRKSIGPDLALAVCDAGVSVYSLQQDGAPLPSALVTPLELHDMADTAAAIAQMDLVITIDSAVAHLAGALGKTCWVLLPYVCDWRWRECAPGVVGAKSSWYDSLRLLRQLEPGRWEPVLAELGKALAQTIANRGGPSA